MATAPDPHEAEKETPEGQEPPEQPPEVNDAEEPSPYDGLAREMGWVSREEFNGPAESWKPADQFIRDGRDIQRNLATELKSVRSTLDNVARTSASLVEQQVAEREQALLTKFNAAVEDGDSKAALTASAELAKLQPQQQGAPAPTPEAQTWVARHAGWFQKDPLATRLAIATCNDLAAMGYLDKSLQLDAAEKEVRRVYPHLFQGTNGTHKGQAWVNSPGSRSAAPSNRAKGFSDMPPEAQKIAKEMVDRGVIPNTDAYVKNWLANQTKGR